MKLFQSQVQCLYDKKVNVDYCHGYANRYYPNGDTFCYHDFYEAEFYLKAEGIHNLDSIPFRVVTGYFFMLIPNEYHCYHLTENTEFEMYNIKFTKDTPNPALISMLAKFQRPYCIYFQNPEFELLLNEINLLQKYTTAAFYDYPMLQNIIDRIILLVLEYLRNSSNTVEGNGAGLVSNGPLHNVIEIINHSYKKDLTASEMAEQMCLSEHYFGIYFKKATGLTFNNYLRRVRLSHAENLLLTTQLSIKEIADAVGFHSQEYFSRTFMSYYTVSPIKYRNQQQKSK